MAAQAYQGHASYGAFKLAADSPENVAPADRPNYDPKAFADQPGAAARVNGYPRGDGQPGGSVH